MVSAASFASTAAPSSSALRAADQFLQLLLDHVDFRTGGRTLFSGQLSQAFQQRRELPFLAEVIDAQLFQRGAIFRPGNRGLGFTGKLFEVFHLFWSRFQFSRILWCSTRRPRSARKQYRDSP